MLKLKFHPEVSSEIKASYLWYQEQAKGLGEAFIDELENSYQAIIEFLQIWPLFQKCFRKFQLAKFPFSVIYRENNSTIYVVAVMHNSRKPGYWLRRT